MDFELTENFSFHVWSRSDATNFRKFRNQIKTKTNFSLSTFHPTFFVFFKLSVFFLVVQFQWFLIQIFVEIVVEDFVCIVVVEESVCTLLILCSTWPHKNHNGLFCHWLCFLYWYGILILFKEKEVWLPCDCYIFLVVVLVFFVSLFSCFCFLDVLL